jgi:hypothetical protein
LRIVCFIMAALLLLPIVAWPANAEAGTGQSVEVKLKIGDENIVINGEKSTIKKPFLSGDSTLVPLRVITTAFGAKITWDPETQGIVLKYGEQTIELIIGDKKAIVNGVEKVIPAAPLIVEGTTMVPLRFISENFGALIQYDNKTKEIILTGTKVATEDGGFASAINNDEGKTKIGDSYFDWSMNYPTGLVKDGQSSTGDWVAFTDAKGQYEIAILVEDNESDYEQSDLIDYLSEYAYGTIIDMRKAVATDPSYAKIVTKSSDGSYSEYRAYLKEDKIYVYAFDISKEADYKDETKKKLFAELMDSFTLSFDPLDPMLKDISLVKNGYITHMNDDYGLSLDLPVRWYTTEYNQGLEFYNPDSDQVLTFSMSSLTDGDSLNQWIARHESRFKQEFSGHYREISPISNLTVAGVPAKARFLSYSHGKEWKQLYDIFLIKGNYKFNFTFEYNKDELQEIVNTMGEILQSVKLDMTKVEDTFGFVKDEYDINFNEKRTVTNKELGYSIEVPKYWDEGGDHKADGQLQYVFNGGWFQINAFSDVNANEFIRQVEEEIENSLKLSSVAKLTEKSITTVNNLIAIKFMISTIDREGNPSTSISFMFSKENTVYIMDYLYTDGVRTPELTQRFNDAVASFVFK